MTGTFDREMLVKFEEFIFYQYQFCIPREKYNSDSGRRGGGDIVPKSNITKDIGNMQFLWSTVVVCAMPFCKV